MTTAQDVINILEVNRAVADYEVEDNGIRFWVGVRAYKELKQTVEDDLEALAGTTLNRERTYNGWIWYFVTIDK